MKANFQTTKTILHDVELTLKTDLVKTMTKQQLAEAQVLSMSTSQLVKMRALLEREARIQRVETTFPNKNEEVQVLGVEIPPDGGNFCLRILK